MWVVKLGGSLARSTHLSTCLQVLSEAHAQRVVVVPGGGVFADTVREAQRLQGFSDQTAHRMALHAMDQFGCLLRELCPRLEPCHRLERISSAWTRGRIPLLAAASLFQQAEVPADWSVTADSLAAYAAQQLHAQHLLLVKSARPAAARVSVDWLAAQGIVDAALPRWLPGRCAAWWVEGDPLHVRQVLETPGPPAARIER